MMMVKVIDRKM